MDPEIKSEWVKRLREPGRKQGQNRLRTINDDGTVSQCCLDVLCEIAVERNVIPAPVNITGAFDITKGQYMWWSEGLPFHEVVNLPKPVAEWAGTPLADIPIGDTTATKLNDAEELTFSEIADRIEADESL